jgi:hypothetical protein
MARSHIQRQAGTLLADDTVRAAGGRLAAAAAGGGLLGGLAMIVLLILYMGTAGMGYATPFNVALAAWVFPVRPPAAMMPALMKALAPVAATHPAVLHAMMALKSGHATNATVATLMSHLPPAQRAMALSHMPIVPAHSAVGLILHFAFAIGTGFAFTAILAGLAWLRVPGMRTPAGLVTASVIGGGLLFLIMDYGILPLLNPIMANAPTIAFLGAHLAYGLGVGVVIAAVLFRGGLLKAMSG